MTSESVESCLVYKTDEPDRESAQNHSSSNKDVSLNEENTTNNMNNSLAESLNESNDINQNGSGSNKQLDDSNQEYEIDEKSSHGIESKQKFIHTNKLLQQQDPYEILKKLEAIKELKYVKKKGLS
jgi:hypothetical protein